MAGYAITITAVDKATATLDRINKSLERPLATASRFEAQITKLARNTGLGTISDGVGRIGRVAVDAARSLERVVAPMAAITGAASVAGVIAMTRAWDDFGMRLGNAAARTGIATDKLQALDNAARLGGAGAGAMTSGMRGLGDAITDAIGGRNSTALMYFNTLGISIRNADGSAKSAVEVMPLLADKIAALQNPALQARVAIGTMGAAAEDLLPFLRRGAAGMREWEEQARRHGVMSERSVEAAQRLNRSFTGVGLSIEGMRNAIAEKLAPVLSPMLDNLSAWIDRNRDLVASKFGEWVEKVGTALMAIDWEKTLGGFSDLVGKLTSILDKTLEWKGVLEAVGLVILYRILGPFGLVFVGIADLLDKMKNGVGGSEPGSGGVFDRSGRDPSASRPFSWWNPGTWLHNRDTAGRGMDPGGTGGFGAGQGPAAAPRVGRGEAIVRPERMGGNVGGNAPEVPHEGRALLRAIAAGESGGDYSLNFGERPGGPHANEAGGAHPNRMVPIPWRPGLNSSAYGAYQFLGHEWDRVSKLTGLTATTPENQDRNAWFLANERYRANTGGRDLAADIKDPAQRYRIGPALSGTWTSVPGGAEPNGATGSFYSRLNQGLAAPSEIQPSAPPMAIAGLGENAVRGKVDVGITLTNPPAGTRTEIASSGDVNAPPATVRRAMPEMLY